jgi:hypothetical protein
MGVFTVFMDFASTTQLIPGIAVKVIFSMIAGIVRIASCAGTCETSNTAFATNNIRRKNTMPSNKA